MFSALELAATGTNRCALATRTLNSDVFIRTSRETLHAREKRGDPLENKENVSPRVALTRRDAIEATGERDY